MVNECRTQSTGQEPTPDGHRYEQVDREDWQDDWMVHSEGFYLLNDNKMRSFVEKRAGVGSWRQEEKVQNNLQKFSLNLLG